MNLDDLPENVIELETEQAPKKTRKPQVSDIIAEPEEDSEPEEESEQDKFKKIIELQGLKNKILRYKVSFDKYLIAYDYKIQDLDNLTLEQLKTLLTEIEICVSSRTSGNMLKNYYCSAVEVGERMAPFLGLNLTGLSKVLGESDQVRECLEELSIKYDVLQYTKPEVRLAYITLQTIFAINTHNKKINEINKVMEASVKKEVIEEFKDL